MNKKHPYKHKVQIGEAYFTKEYIKYQPWAVAAVERDGGRCVDCASSTNLLVHHLDESRKNGYKSMNNELSNLLTLCRKCHAKVHKTTLRDINPDKFFNIVKLRRVGNTLQQIGDIYGVSRERIRQILVKAKEENLLY